MQSWFSSLYQDLSKESEYLDLKVYRTNLGLKIMLDDKLPQVFSEGGSAFALKALRRGAWAFLSGHGRPGKSDRAMFRRLIRMINKTPNQSSPLPTFNKIQPVKARVHSPVRIDVQNVQPDELGSVMRWLKAEMMSGDPKMKCAKVEITSESAKQLFVNSEGTEIEQPQYHSSISLTARLTDRGRACSYRNSISKRAGLEILDPNDVKCLADNTVEKCRDLLHAAMAPQGKMRVVMNPSSTGVFIHEVFGHMIEADVALERGGILKLNHSVGPRYLNVVDDPKIKDGFGSYHFDEEGVPAVRKVLVKRGLLTSFLCDRTTAPRMHLNPTGNSRSASVHDLPMVRMSNMYLEAGDWHLEELLQEVRRGILVEKIIHGTRFPTGLFNLKAQLAYQIRRGQIVRPVRDISITGLLSSALEKITAVGRDVKLEGTHCIKNGQAVPVGIGGPHVLIEGLNVARESYSRI